MCAFQILASTVAVLVGFPDTCWDRTWIVSWVFPSESFAVHHLPVKFPFDTNECDVPDAIVKWTIHNTSENCTIPKVCPDCSYSCSQYSEWLLLAVCWLLVQSCDVPKLQCGFESPCLSLLLLSHWRVQACGELCFLGLGPRNCPHLQKHTSQSISTSPSMTGLDAHLSRAATLTFNFQSSSN